MNRTRTFTRLIFVLSVTACGAPDEGTELEAVDTTAEAFGESSCVTAAASAVVDSYAESWPSPTTYDNINCSKTLIHHLRQGIGSVSMHAVVRWGDPWKRNEVQCRGGKLNIELQSGNGAFQSNGVVSFPLFWEAGRGICWYPTVVIDEHAGLPVAAFARYLAPSVPGAGDQPSIGGSLVRVPFSGTVLGKTTRIAAQALTPGRSTQSISVEYDTQ